MREQLLPQLIQVDPMRIKFNEHNPRQHQGAEYFRLKESVKHVGVVQAPTVRVLSGGFYECIDGEGRVKAAQEAGLSWIWVVCIGKISDIDALTMLQAANVVRTFSYLAGCKGLVNLYRQGQTSESIAHNLGMSCSAVQTDIAVGCIPEYILTRINEDMLRTNPEGLENDGVSYPEPLGQKRTFSWSARTFAALLPLRIQIKKKSEASILDDLYDYTEVHQAVEKIIHGEITTFEQLQWYVERRQRELFEERFDTALQLQLEDERKQTRQALEEAHTQRLQQTEVEMAERYDTHIAHLQRQLDELEKRYHTLIREVATRPALLEKHEVELRKKLQETEEERLQLQKRSQALERETQIKRQQMEQQLKSQAETALKEQRAAMEREFAQVRIDLEAYYAKKDHDRQFRVEKTIQQAIAHGTELLCQSQQWLLLLLTPSMIKSLTWLREPDVVSLLAQMQAVHSTLEQAEDMIMHGDVSDSVSTDTEEETPYAHNTHQGQPSTHLGY